MVINPIAHCCLIVCVWFVCLPVVVFHIYSNREYNNSLNIGHSTILTCPACSSSQAVAGIASPVRQPHCVQGKTGSNPRSHSDSTSVTSNTRPHLGQSPKQHRAAS